MPERNRLQHDGVSVLKRKGARALFDIQILSQPVRDHYLAFTSEANSVRLSSGLHNSIITVTQSIVRLYRRVESNCVSLPSAVGRFR